MVIAFQLFMNPNGESQLLYVKTLYRYVYLKPEVCITSVLKKHLNPGMIYRVPEESNIINRISKRIFLVDVIYIDNKKKPSRYGDSFLYDFQFL